MSQPQFKQMRRAYGFDEVAIVPGGHHTINPDLVELSFKLNHLDFQLPFFAAAMDGVVDVRMAVEFSHHGGLAVLNLEGVQTRYDDPAPVLAEIAAAPRSEVTALMQKVYSAPIKPELIGERIREIKAAGGISAVSATPPNTKKFAPIARDAGVDVFVVQSTVTSARHISRSEKGLIFEELVRNMRETPVVVGNTVTFAATKELMETGIAAVLVGVGPGAACTSREVLGIGVPQVTATIDAAAARDTYYRESGRYVPIITDGGVSNGGAMRRTAAWHARQGRDRHDRATDAVRTDIAHGRPREPRWRAADRHGHVRSADDPRLPEDRDGHRAVDQDGGQVVPDGAGGISSQPLALSLGSELRV
jgi:IMP dehydrogenase